MGCVCIVAGPEEHHDNSRADDGLPAFLLISKGCQLSMPRAQTFPSWLLHVMPADQRHHAASGAEEGCAVPATPHAQDVSRCTDGDG